MNEKVRLHPFHLVDPSPWPILTSIAALCLVLGAVLYMHSYTLGFFLLPFGLLFLVLVMGIWWRDVIRESKYEKAHTDRVRRGLKLGFILFIVSEVMFFVAFFWAFFHSSLSPTIQLGCFWPPKGIVPFNPFDVPLVNTFVLLISGITITWTHKCLVIGKTKGLDVHVSFLFTLILAVTFTLLQLMEYIKAPFNISDSIYGSTFFMLTGFHGFHVIIGTTFIFVCYMRYLVEHFSAGKSHLGFELSTWYWHFVDGIWILLYFSVYLWSGASAF